MAGVPAATLALTYVLHRETWRMHRRAPSIPLPPDVPRTSPLSSSPPPQCSSLASAPCRLPYTHARKRAPTTTRSRPGERRGSTQSRGIIKTRRRAECATSDSKAASMPVRQRVPIRMTAHPRHKHRHLPYGAHIRHQHSTAHRRRGAHATPSHAPHRQTRAKDKRLKARSRANRNKQKTAHRRACIHAHTCIDRYMRVCVCCPSLAGVAGTGWCEGGKVRRGEMGAATRSIRTGGQSRTRPARPRRAHRAPRRKAVPARRRYVFAWCPSPPLPRGAAPVPRQGKRGRETSTKRWRRVRGEAEHACPSSLCRGQRWLADRDAEVRMSRMCSVHQKGAATVTKDEEDRVELGRFAMHVVRGGEHCGDGGGDGCLLARLPQRPKQPKDTRSRPRVWCAGPRRVAPLQRVAAQRWPLEATPAAERRQCCPRTCGNRGSLGGERCAATSAVVARPSVAQNTEA